MNKILFAAVAAAAIVMPVSAQETVKSLYSGEAYNVTWEHTLRIDASEFAENVKVGDYMSVSLSNATDVLEIKANGSWLPGSVLSNIAGKDEFKAYITYDMLKSLKEYGVEICGASFTVNSVEIKNDGFAMPDGAIWGGYFWVDNWNTLELFKTAFDTYNGERYMDIYLSEDNGDYTGYFMKVLTAWDNPDAVWADNDRIDHEPGKAVVDLQGINVKEALATVNCLMIQSNPESGNPYNITAVALRPDEGTGTGVESPVVDSSAVSAVYNLQGMKVAELVAADVNVSNLPAGIYIVNGKKIAVR